MQLITNTRNQTIIPNQVQTKAALKNKSRGKGVFGPRNRIPEIRLKTSPTSFAFNTHHSSACTGKQKSSLSMPSFPQPGSVTICEINRDLSINPSLSLSLSLYIYIYIYMYVCMYSVAQNFRVCDSEKKSVRSNTDTQILQLPRRIYRTMEPRTLTANFL